jgi:hypothetical protein
LVRQGLGAHVVGAGVDVDEIDLAPQYSAQLADATKVFGGPQHIARAEAQCHAGDVQGRCRAVHGDGMTRAGVRRHAVLESRDGRALGEVDGLHHLDDGVDVCLGDVLLAVADHGVCS